MNFNLENIKLVYKIFLGIITIGCFFFLEIVDYEYDCNKLANAYRKDTFNFKIEKIKDFIGSRSHVLSGRDSLGNLQSWEDNGDWIMHNLDFFEVGAYIHKPKGKSIVIRKYLYGKIDTLKFACKGKQIE
jgi:hypothetical protein